MLGFVALHICIVLLGLALGIALGLGLGLRLLELLFVLFTIMTNRLAKGGVPVEVLPLTRFIPSAGLILRGYGAECTRQTNRVIDRFVVIDRLGAFNRSKSARKPNGIVVDIIAIVRIVCSTFRHRLHLPRFSDHMPKARNDLLILSHDREVINKSTDNANNRRDDGHLLRERHRLGLEVLERGFAVVVALFLGGGLARAIGCRG